MSDFDDPSVFKKIDKMLLGEEEIPEEKSEEDSDMIFNGFKSPIRISYKNSGEYSLTPTDARHTKNHLGIDMRAPGGTPIFSIAPGKVTKVYTTEADQGSGLTVKIEHQDNVASIYCHCGTVKVKIGDEVGYNTQIATVGDSGNAKGTYPHLHFEIKSGGSNVNPRQFISGIPTYDPDTKGESMWLSEDAKKEARNFSLDEHLKSDKQSKASKKIERILKLSSQFEYLCKKN